MVLYQSRHDATEYGRLAQLVEHLLDVQEVTGSSPVPSTKTRASDLGQGLFCCVCHCLTSEQDGTGLEQQRSRPPPAAETGRRGWGRVLIFQGPVKGLRKNQQTQLVRAAHLSYSFCRNVYQESTTCQSIFSASASSNNRPIAKGRVSSWRCYPAFCALWLIGEQSLRMSVHGRYARTQEKGKVLAYRG